MKVKAIFVRHSGKHSRKHRLAGRENNCKKQGENKNTEWNIYLTDCIIYTNYLAYSYNRNAISNGNYYYKHFYPCLYVSLYLIMKGFNKFDFGWSMYTFETYGF